MKKVITITIMILILLFNKVKADTLEKSVWHTYYTDSNYNTALSDNTFAYQYFTPTANGNNISFQYVYINPTITKTENNDYITIPFLISGREFSVASFSEGGYMCSYREVISGNDTLYQPYNCSYSAPDGNHSEPVDINFKFSISLVATDGLQQANCKIENDMIVCQLQKNITYNMLSIRYTLSDNNSTINYKFNIYHAISYYTNAQDRIVEKQTETNNILTENATYEDTPTEDFTNETQQMNEYSNLEDQLIQSMDFNGTLLEGITINPNSSWFIWRIADRLRGINPGIILLMTSMLGLGLIKMVLSR